MLCPSCVIQMHQKARIGDGESNDVNHSTWELKECPVCGRQIVEFYAAVVVDNPEQARMVGGMLIARVAEVAI